MLVYIYACIHTYIICIHHQDNNNIHVNCLVFFPGRGKKVGKKEGIVVVAVAMVILFPSSSSIIYDMHAFPYK